MGLIWLSPKNIIYCPGCSKSVAIVGSVKNLLSCSGTHSKGLNAMIYSIGCNNDGAKQNRELYLKIMYTWVKKILPLPKFWPFFSNQHDSWLYPLFCPSFCLLAPKLIYDYTPYIVQIFCLLTWNFYHLALIWTVRKYLFWSKVWKKSID